MNQKQTWDRQQIEECLQSAITDLTPDIWDRLDQSLVQQEPFQPQMLEKPEVKQNKAKNTSFPFLRRAGSLAAAACLGIVLAGGSYYYEFRQVVTVVGLDVNPSIELSLNRRDRVVASKAVNEDGQSVIARQEIRGCKLEEAVDSVITVMTDEGYLKKDNEEKSAVLITVSSQKREKKKEELRQAVSSNVETSLASNEVKAVVYEQTITADETARQEVLEIAEEYQISQGKASFIQSLVEENESVSTEDVPQLAVMTMGEISQQIDENEYQLKSEVQVTAVTEETIRQVKESRQPELETSLESTETIPSRQEETKTEEIETGKAESAAQEPESSEPAEQKSDEAESAESEPESGKLEATESAALEPAESEADEAESAATETAETEADEAESAAPEPESSEPAEQKSDEAKSVESESESGGPEATGAEAPESQSESGAPEPEESESEESAEAESEESEPSGSEAEIPQCEEEDIEKPDSETKPAGVKKPETIWTDSEPIETKKQEAIRIDEETPAIINRDRAHKILKELEGEEWIWRDDAVSGMLPGPGTIQWGRDTAEE